MADKNGNSITNKKSLPINLSLFTLTETPVKSTSSAIKSPKNFEEPNGVVGLGILAAMGSNCKNECNFQDQFLKRTAVLAVSPKSSNPIPILSNKKSASLSPKNKRNPTSDSDANMEKWPSAEGMELCEEYTCVISRGENQIKKRDYFYDGGLLENKNFVINGSGKITANISAWSSASSAVNRRGETDAFRMADFLSFCFLCKKKLHGLDIFMYRGEKAFCSAECRCKQIALDDEHKERCSGGRKPHEYSVSPCSTNAMQVFAGVAAA